MYERRDWLAMYNIFNVFTIGLISKTSRNSEKKSKNVTMIVSGNIMLLSDI
jgi:hypothetical protein